jgi:hypothetical protein
MKQEHQDRVGRQPGAAINQNNWIFTERRTSQQERQEDNLKDSTDSLENVRQNDHHRAPARLTAWSPMSLKLDQNQVTVVVRRRERPIRKNQVAIIVRRRERPIREDQVAIIVRRRERPIREDAIGCRRKPGQDEVSCAIIRDA